MSPRPILGSWTGSDIKAGLFVKSQSRIPVSLVRTLTDWVTPHKRWIIVAEKLVEDGFEITGNPY